MVRNNAYVLGLCLLGAFGATGCMTDDVSETKDNTSLMNLTTSDLRDTTRHMDETTTRLNRRTDELYDTTDHMYTDLRQGNSLQIRMDALERMEKAEKLMPKIAEAGDYVMAFEFQLWKDTGSDTDARRLGLYKDAMLELLKHFKRYTAGDQDKRDPSPLSRSEDKENIYALVSVLHRVNPNAEALNRERGQATVSVLDVLMSGLAAKKQVESGAIPSSDIPAYVSEILREEADVVYALQLRANFLPVVMLARMSKLDDTGASGLVAKVKAFVAKWDTQIPELNVEQIRYLALIMQHANRTADFLHSIGQSARLDAKVRKILANAKIQEQAITAVMTDEEVAVAGTHNEAIRALQAEVTRFLANN
jgi:hypothetical protein